MTQQTNKDWGDLKYLPPTKKIEKEVSKLLTYLCSRWVNDEWRLDIKTRKGRQIIEQFLMNRELKLPDYESKIRLLIGIYENKLKYHNENPITGIAKKLYEEIGNILKSYIKDLQNLLPPEKDV